MSEFDVDDFLKVKPLKTDKSKIKTRPCMDSGIIPKHPCSVAFIASSGGGKTQLVLNLLLKKEFYKDRKSVV